MNGIKMKEILVSYKPSAPQLFLICPLLISKSANHEKLLSSSNNRLGILGWLQRATDY
jgi:hypothetical protein